MIFTEIKDYIISFYRESNRPTFWFAVIVLSQLLAFIPHIPSSIIYVTFILYALYVLNQSDKTYYLPLLIFCVYIPIQLVVVQPDAIFRSWERFVLFALLLVCVSPLVIGEASIEYRKTIFRLSLVTCAFLGVGSFIARFIGLNYGSIHQTIHIYSVGTFGGLTSHSMLLGPIAGIGAVFCCWLSMTRKYKIYWILSLACVFAVMFSASRSALMAVVAGVTVLIYKLSDSGTVFVKIVVGIILLGSVTFPIWGSALDAVIIKNQSNINAGGAYSSREALWQSRLLEFESSPVFGVGFDAVDVNIARSAGGYDTESGMVESGSSWLIILSMTGMIGLLIVFPVLFNAYKTVFTRKDEFSALVCGVLTLFYVHMIAEGYIFYGGSMLAFLLWITLGIAHDCKYELE